MVGSGSGAPFFGPFVKMEIIDLDPSFGTKISGNIFDHKEDNLGIILRPISGLLRQLVSIL